jgi:PEP-CTERM motif
MRHSDIKLEGRKMKALLLTTAAVVMLSGPAMAAINVVDVEAGLADNAGIVTIDGIQPWVTPIELTTDTGKTFFTFCDDFNHTITIEGGQNLDFVQAPVTTNGSGVGLTESQSNIMGQLTRIGLNAFAAGNFDLSIASQVATWVTEGEGPATSTNATVESDITMLLDTVHNNGTGFAMGLISPDGVQGQILPSAAVPEPATWAMMLLGFIGLGYAARQRRVA